MLEHVRAGSVSLLRALPEAVTRPPVLFIHGYFADASIFGEWLSFFAARGFPAYAVHLRGHGPEPQRVDLGHVSIADFVDDAAGAARFIGSPVVIGHSMGGLIAQRLAAEHGVRAAVLLAPAPPRGISVLSPGLVARQLRYLPAIIASRIVHPARGDLRALPLNRVPRDEQDGILERLQPDSGRAARDMSITGVPVDATQVHCPMLVITGTDDRFIPPRIAVRVAERYDARVQSFAGHGHMLPIEPGWRDVADAVARWIGDVVR